MSITLEELKHYADMISMKKMSAPVGTLLSRLARKEVDADPVSDIRELRSGA